MTCVLRCLVNNVDVEALQNPRRAFCGDLLALFRAVEFRDLEAGLSCVMGIGSDAWDRFFGSLRPAELYPFREIRAMRLGNRRRIRHFRGWKLSAPILTQAERFASGRGGQSSHSSDCSRRCGQTNRKQPAGELNRQVAERTKELAEANEAWESGDADEVGQSTDLTSGRRWAGFVLSGADLKKGSKWGSYEPWATRQRKRRTIVSAGIRELLEGRRLAFSRVYCVASHVIANFVSTLDGSQPD